MRSLRGARLEFMLPLTDRHFTRGYSQEETMSVGCLVMRSGQVVANDTRTIRKEEQVARLGSHGSHGSQGQSRGDRGLFSTEGVPHHRLTSPSPHLILPAIFFH